ncbi:DciA family protein [Chlamydia sp. 17-3921]|uniref:DciA family protein n=1 Tax=Chlamydia sp. 17-3921 TaxID=2675798 RepID=UPI00191A8AC4|nr:DciA family protein [Chlamydia sp. 17-3921]
MFLKRKKREFSKAYNKRTASPIKHAKHRLQVYLKEIQQIMSSRPHEVIDAWNQFLGDKYVGMSQAIGFKNHVLLVKVYNSSLYAQLKQTNQGELISCVHKIAPHAKIQEIQFLLG